METGQRVEQAASVPGDYSQGDDGSEIHPPEDRRRDLGAGITILVITLLAGSALPGSVIGSGPALCIMLVLTGAAFTVLRHRPALAGLAGALPAAAHLAYVAFEGSPIPLGTQAGIFIVCWTAGMGWMLTLDKIQRQKHHEIRELNRKIRRIQKEEADREEAFIRMNKSLTLEIRAHSEAETRLRESEEKYKYLVDSLPEGVLIVQDRKIVFFNPGFERLSGHDRNTLTGADPERFFGRRFNDGDPSRNHFEVSQSDGSKRFIDLQRVDIQFNSKPARLYTVRDMTERVRTAREKKQLEAKLEKAKKMEALGLMAAGVAHDLNNVLSGIVSTPELLLLELSEDSSIRETVFSIKEAGKRASVIVDELLTLGRGAPKILTPVNLNYIVTDYLISPEFEVASKFHPRIQVDTRLEDTLSVISASAILIRKVVMNLVTNAMEAVQDTGRVLLSTRNLTFDQNRLKGYEGALKGDYVRLRISDNGPGISDQDLDRIFEPFYTKKILGRSGTGLGLSIVWNIVHDLKGFIQVESNESGSCFDLYFPVAADLQNAPEPDRIYTLSDYTGNGQQILVVDDERSQLRITTNMLSRMGYRTAAVTSGEAALAHVRANPVDLAVIDMIMAPGMDGLETFRELRTIHPEIKSVLASGYAETEDVSAAQDLGAGPFIKKPFSLQTLGLAVKNELERADNDRPENQ